MVQSPFNGQPPVVAGLMLLENLVSLRPLATLLPLALATPPAIAAPVSGELAQVQQHLRGVQTMVADFSQTDRTGKVLTGTITLKQPGKIRFQYQQGVPILVVADGGSLWFLDYSVGQKQRWPIRNSPLGILLDPSRDISGIAKVNPAGDSRIVSIDAADPRHPEYGRITLVFARDAAAPAGLKLQGWVALDAQNNRTTVRLSNQRFGAPVSDGTFRFNDPQRNAPKK